MKRVKGYWLLVIALISASQLFSLSAYSQNVNVTNNSSHPVPVVVYPNASASATPQQVHETGTPSTGAGENFIGKVGGTTDVISPTITVSTSPAYTANDVVGGKLTLTNAMRVSGGTGILQSMVVIDKSNQKVALEILIFDSNPSSGTYTDNGAYSWNATDGAKLIRRISVAASDYATFGTAAVADLSPGGKVLKASGSRDLYAVIITTGTPTYAATTDLIIRFGILQD